MSFSILQPLTKVGENRKKNMMIVLTDYSIFGTRTLTRQSLRTYRLIFISPHSGNLGPFGSFKLVRINTDEVYDPLVSQFTWNIYESV